MKLCVLSVLMVKNKFHMETILDLPENRILNFRYSNFWTRFAALFIDAVIISIASSLFAIIFLNGYSYSSFATNPFSLLVGWLYFAGMESSSNMGTFGKITVGIMVVSEQGERISFMNATGRYFAKFISCILLLIGYIMAAFDSRHQALHDKLAKTFVIYKN